jgi:hypothetical protein
MVVVMMVIVFGHGAISKCDLLGWRSFYCQPPAAAGQDCIRNQEDGATALPTPI